MSEQIHYIQRKILADLLFSDNQSYSDLKPEELEGSHFTFHLKKLISDGWVQKREDGKYELTAVGKGKANEFDPESKTPNRQAKHSVVMCGVSADSQKILIYQRLKNPYYGRYGFPTGKVQYGEKISDTARREFTEETNLTGDPTLIAIRHYRVYYPDKSNLVEDKVMYIHRIDNVTGDLHSNDEGKFFWQPVNELALADDQQLPEFAEILDILLNYAGELTLAESKHYPSSF